jgi:hypothetical protein
MINGYTFSGVNPDTVKMAPREAMQWGRTLNHILWYVSTANRRQGTVLLSKTDLSDSFYQFHLTPSGALSLATPFPNLPGEPQLVAIPTVLPMGWTESPPAFFAVTETVADLVNESLEASAGMPPPHPLEPIATVLPALQTSLPDQHPVIDSGPLHPKLAYTNVYVDDFCKAAQGWLNAIRVRRTTYHAIDSVFRPNDDLDIGRKQPISVKKL